MAAPVTLLMAIHCHQPVGNFGFVFEEAYAKAYEPFLSVLERHPQVRLALHYSGPLLDWFTAHRPAFLRRVKTLVGRGQVELLASGYYEPILPLIPEADRQGQIAQMRAALRRHCGADATGLWLTERVWEPELPATLARAGIRYTMVDTNQFLPVRPWLPADRQMQDADFWDVFGCYTTEAEGASVLLFPASKRLRYWLPFQAVERTIEFLRRAQRDEPVAVTFADDGEKFGLWPKTFHWVYDEGWLEQFFAALECERSWLATSTFGDYVSRAGANGHVYLPCGSYEEMLEWSGGNFRNFFLKYPEANAMQQRMLRVSRQLQNVRKANSKLITRARQALYAGQCNCAYWHGVFGGLYLSHLRRAVSASLIEAERLTRQAAGARASVTHADADGDGRDEAWLETAAMSLVVDAEEGGAITEWNLARTRVNLLDTLSRRPEPYHEKLKAAQMQGASVGGSAPASIHDALGVKEAHLESRLLYDDHRRSAFLDSALQRMPTLQEVVRSTWGEARIWSSVPFQWDRAQQRKAAFVSVTMARRLADGSIRKTVRIGTKAPRLECVYELKDVPVPVVALEFNLSLQDARYLHEPGERREAVAFTVEDTDVGVSLRLSLDRPATLFHFPVETVSESEEGLERTYQGLCVVCCWPVEGARSWASRLQWMVTERPSIKGP